MHKLLSCEYKAHTLYFYRPAGTSRGILYEKTSYFLIAKSTSRQIFYGECGLLKGLSIDDRPGYEDVLHDVCNAILEDKLDTLDLSSWPSIQCGLEILMQALEHESNDVIFDNDFYRESKSIPINGLIWMGDASFMKSQIQYKIESGFRCIKMKVGAIDWGVEKKILQYLRATGGEDLVIRVDANGAWNWNDDTKEKLTFLHELKIHSIEQPIEVNKWDELANLIRWSPVDIALDEELFEHITHDSRATLLDTLRPEYIVLKPSLVGGFAACDDWINLCKEREIGFWLTSALESNVALNAIAQYAYPYAGDFYQGLGTGSLYENNIASPLEILGDTITFNKKGSWDYSNLE